jgi:glycosyltransferase involved in cell wall biosynthesis
LRILLVSSCLPHAGARHASGKLVHYLLETLAARHEVTVFARHFPDEEELLEQVRSRHPRLTSIPAPEVYREGSVASLSRAAASVRRLARAAARAEGRFDLCQVESSEAGFFWPRRMARSSVLSCHDLLCKPALRRLEVARGRERLVAWPMWLLKSALERRALRRFGGVFVMSDIDREWAARVYPGVAVDVLRYPGGIGFAGLPRAEIAGRVAFLGTLQRSANAFSLRYFLREVWPLVLARSPEAEFVVAGVGAPPELVGELAAARRVRYLGEVESVESFYASASVFVAPVLIGGGVIVKVLDALAAGVPVVTTSRGNEGIGAVAGRDLEVGDSAEEMAARIDGLLRDPERRSALGRAGRSFERESFSAERFVAALEQVYERVAGGRSGSAG